MDILMAAAGGTHLSRPTCDSAMRTKKCWSATESSPGFAITRCDQPSHAGRSVAAMYEIPTLYIELVDRADSRRPSVLLRAPVCVTVDEVAPGPPAPSRGFVEVRSSQLPPGCRLGMGDVVVVIVRPSRADDCFLAEVVATDTDCRYSLAILGGTSLEQWVSRSEDPRWDLPIAFPQRPVHLESHRASPDARQ